MIFLGPCRGDVVLLEKMRPYWSPGEVNGRNLSPKPWPCFNSVISQPCESLGLYLKVFKDEYEEAGR